jgi:hypothetical protein
MCLPVSLNFLSIKSCSLVNQSLLSPSPDKDQQAARSEVEVRGLRRPVEDDRQGGGLSRLMAKEM